MSRIRGETAQETGQRTAAQSVKIAPPAVGRGDLGPEAQAALIRSTGSAGGDGLSEEERQLLRQLSARDKEVRDHEEAHARVGGPYAGSPSYDYQTGPDGQRYAIGGSVPIDVSPVRGDPEATIAKMEIVKAAALAPAEPSAADRQIAALADANRLKALTELAAQKSDTRQGGDNTVVDIKDYLESLEKVRAERGVLPGDQVDRVA